MCRSSNGTILSQTPINRPVTLTVRILTNVVDLNLNFNDIAIEKDGLF